MTLTFKPGVFSTSLSCLRTPCAVSCLEALANVPSVTRLPPRHYSVYTRLTRTAKKDSSFNRPSTPPRGLLQYLPLIPPDGDAVSQVIYLGSTHTAGAHYGQR